MASPRSGALRRPEPVPVVHLFAEDRAALLALLRGLDEADWARPTACGDWSVHDVARHMLAVDLANLSGRRDGFRAAGPGPGEPLAAWLNRFNEEWVAAARRLSPRVVVDLLAHVGPPLFETLAALDPAALGGPVSWAGPGPAPVWLDLAREFTERWHHQQHIRDAVGRPGQTEPRYLGPVLATFMHALPEALRGAEAPVGATVHVHLDGDGGGDWAAAREHDGWRLWLGQPERPLSRVELASDVAWRLLTRGLTAEQAAARVRIAGDRALGERVLGAVAIIA